MEDWFPFIFVLAMVAGVMVIFMAMRQRSQFVEMQHRERMAMIERGLTPGDGPIVSGGPLHQRHVLVRHDRVPAPRSMTLGIVVVAVGLGLMSIVGIAAGAPEVAVGIGGAIVIVGAAFIVNSMVWRSIAAARPHDPPPSPPLPPIDRVE